VAVILNNCSECESGKGHRPSYDSRCSFCDEYLIYVPELDDDSNDEDFDDIDDTFAVCCGHIFGCLECLSGGHPVGFGSTPDCIRCGEMHSVTEFVCCGHKQRYVGEDDNEFDDLSDDDDYEEDEEES
jgi:hypothetical protein